MEVASDWQNPFFTVTNLYFFTKQNFRYEGKYFQIVNGTAERDCTRSPA
jgi:hypothetical protein